MNPLTNAEIVVALGPTTSSTADSTSAVVDLANCDGAEFYCQSGSNTGSVAFSLITGSTSDATGSTVATQTSTLADRVVHFTLHKPTKRYAKVVAAPGATAADGVSVVVRKYGVRVGPVSQGSTSVAASTLLVGSS